MKAIILAAGKGTRLGKITKEIPKPMILYKGKPILQYNIELCKKYGITEVFINLHHLGNRIQNYFEDGKKFGVNIKYSFESELMGTAGAVRKIAEDFWCYFTTINSSPVSSIIDSTRYNDTISPCDPFSLEPFFVIYGDNFSDYNLKSLIDLYTISKTIGVIGFHYREDVSNSGVAEFDQDNRIMRFIEKPKSEETNSHWVNAGIYYLAPSVLDHIPYGFFDFGRDIFPSILQKGIPIYGIYDNTQVKAFDTLEMIKKNM